MIFGREPVHLEEAIFATLGTWAFHAFLGVMFVYLIEKILTRENLYVKGWFFGIMWWFIIYAVTFLFKVPELAFIPFKTALSNFIGATIWGLILAQAFVWLEQKTRISH